MIRFYQVAPLPFRGSAPRTSSPSRKQARAIQAGLLPRPETPPPVYEKTPRRDRRAYSNLNDANPEDTLPIYNRVNEDSSKALWKTKKGIIILSVLATALFIGGVLGTVLGLTVSHRGRVTSPQEPVSSAGSSTGGIASTPTVVSSQGSTSVGALSTSLPSVPSLSSFAGSSKTTQGAETTSIETSTEKNPSVGNGGDSGNTASFSTPGSNTWKAASGPTTVLNHPGSSISVGSSTSVSRTTSISNGPNDGGGHFSGPANGQNAKQFAQPRPVPPIRRRRA